MTLNVSGVGYWNWVEQNGGWTERSTDRETIVQGSVTMEVDVAKANHVRAALNMALAAAVVLLLLTFVVFINWTMWKMLVQPLDRIFHSIRTNAAQVVAALGNPEDEQGHGRGSKNDDLDIITIEAAVTKMGRILEQYTSTGGVGLNAVKKMATNADQSTKEWLATMVAGPGSEEVVSGRTFSDIATVGARGRGTRHPLLLPPYGQGNTPLRAAYAGRPGGGGGGGGDGGGGGVQRRSRLGRMSEIQVVGQQGQGPLMAHAMGDTSTVNQRRSSLAQFQQRTSSKELSSGSEAGAPAASPQQSTSGSATPHQPPPQQQQPQQHNLGKAHGKAGGAAAKAAVKQQSGGGAPSAPGSDQPVSPEPRTSVLGPSLDALLATSSSASSDAAALSSAAAKAQAPSEAWSQLGSSSLPEAEKKLLATVDVDYLHSYGFDAMGIPPSLQPAYMCAMFLELDLAYFSGADAALIDEPAPAGQHGFVDVATLWRFVAEVSSIYRNVPYHNFRHCLDVTHTTFMFIKRVAHKVLLTELEKFALLVAAVSHDLDHPGVNNAFLVNARDPLATTYNDSSVLENRHVAALYGLLLSKPQLNIFARLEPAQWKEVRKMVIGAVLSTDMVHHFPMVSKLEVFYELHAANIQAHHRALRQGLPRDNLARLFDTAEERQLLLNLLLHCADISNPVKPAAIAEAWADRVLAEFFLQGDRERAAGLAISPMCDRDKTSRAGSQINFIEFVVAPIYAQVYKIFPELGEALDNLMANRHFWQDALTAELAASDTAAAPDGGRADNSLPRPPEQRVLEEQGKADKRLRYFQDKYRDILSKRKTQLVRLASTQSSKQSFFSVAAAAPGLHGRHGSLMALIEAAEGLEVTERSKSNTGLLGKLGRNLTNLRSFGSITGAASSRESSRCSSPRGATLGGVTGSPGSLRSSDVSAESSPAGSPNAASGIGCLGGGLGRVAPDDDCGV